jgi:hypothetical protein
LRNGQHGLFCEAVVNTETLEAHGWRRTGVMKETASRDEQRGE